MNLRLIDNLFLFVSCLNMISCSNGKLSVQSLGATLSAPQFWQSGILSQRIVKNKVKANWTLEISCDSLTRSIEYSVGDPEHWLLLQEFQCPLNGKYGISLTETQIGTSAETSVSLRTVGDKGISSVAKIEFIDLEIIPETLSVSADTLNGFTNKDQIELSLAGRFQDPKGEQSNPFEMLITQNQDCSTEGSWQSFNSHINWTLKNKNSTNNLFVKFRDIAENESLCQQITIQHDSIQPVADYLLINNMSNSNNIIRSTLIDLNIQANSDASEMKISANANCTGGVWETYSLTHLGWQVTTMNSLNSVSIRFRDHAHNESQCLFQNYTHDNFLPQAPVIQLMFGSSPSRNESPILRINGLVIGDFVRIYKDSNCNFEISNFIYTGSDIYLNPLLPTNGSYGFYADVKDLAGNQIQCVGSLLNYEFDSIAPVAIGSGHPVSLASGLISWFETITVPDGTHYKWKIGVANSVDCNLPMGYSPWYNNIVPLYLDIGSLAEGPVKLCLSSKDAAGNEQFPSTAYSWIKNTALITAQIISGQPNSPSKFENLSLGIGGNTVVDYKFKLGTPLNPVTCSEINGYSSWVSASIPLLLNLSNQGLYPDGNFTLCLLGRNGFSVEQDLISATSFTWSKDTQSPILTSVGHPTGIQSNMKVWTEIITSTEQDYYRWKIGPATSTDCSLDSGYSSWIVSQSSFNVDVTNLPDENLNFCLSSKDIAGNIQTVPTVYSWIKNMASIKAQLNTPLPSGSPSNITNFTLQVGYDPTGDIISEYKYKFGPSSTTDCQLSTNYSPWAPSSTLISLNVAAVSDGVIRFCLLGRNTAGTEQNILFPTSYEWVKDTIAPVPVTVYGPLARAYITNEDLVFTVEFNEDVEFVPTTTAGNMNVLIGGSIRTANYYLQSAPNRLQYLYRLATGENGSIQHGSNISLTGQIKDLAGNLLTSSSGLVAKTFTGVTASNNLLNIEWTQTYLEVAENAGSAQLTLSLSSPLSTDLTLFYDVDSTNATNGIDFNLPAGSFVVPAGQTTATLSIPIINNGLVNKSRRRILIDLMGGARGMVNTTKKIAEISIYDDEISMNNSTSDPAVQLLLNNGNSGYCFRTQSGQVYCGGGAIVNGSTGTEFLPHKVDGIIHAIDLFSLGGPSSYIPVLIGTTTCVLDDGAGSIQWKCWGYNNVGQVGDGSTINATQALALNNIGSNSTLIRAATDGACVRDGANVKCWGDGSSYRNGNSTTTNLLIPSTVTQLSAAILIKGTSTRCGLFDNDGNAANGHDLKCWGQRGLAAGVGNTSTVATPNLIQSNVIDFELGYQGGCAVGNFDGNSVNGNELKCWGYNGWGQVGNGSTVNQLIPISETTGLHGVKKVFTQLEYSAGEVNCAIGDFDSVGSGDEVACWGYNGWGQVGNGLTTAQTSPYVIPGLSGVIDLRISQYVVCAEISNKDLYCWGSGFGGVPSRRTVSGSIQKYEAGSSFIIALNQNGGLVCEGTGCPVSLGILPTSGVTDFSLNTSNLCYLILGRVQCKSLQSGAFFGMQSPSLTNFTSIYSSGISKIIGNKYATNLCVELTSNPGVLSCTQPHGYSGVLGNTSSAQTFDGKLSTNLNSNNLIAWHTSYGCALDNNQNLFCWGGIHPSPMGISSGVSLLDDSDDSNSSRFDFISHSNYRSVTGFGPGVGITPSLTGIKNLAAGGYHNCAVKQSDGSVQCWTISSTSDNNRYGQMGDGTSSVTAIPLNTLHNVSFISGIEKLFASIYSTCALQNDELKCWGYGFSSISPYSWLQPDTLATGVADVKMNGQTLCFQKTTDSGWYCGTLGPSLIFPSTPTISNTEEFSIFGNAMCARFASGEVQCKGGTPQDFGRIYDIPPQYVW